MQPDPHPDKSPVGRPRVWDAPTAFHPTEADVSALISAAARHPSGLDLLLRGHLGTVAIMFGTHAFTVVAARERLLKPADDRTS